MNGSDRARKMHTDVVEINMYLPELYNFIPRQEFYRLKQLLEEAMQILGKYK